MTAIIRCVDCKRPAIVLITAGDPTSRFGQRSAHACREHANNIRFWAGLIGPITETPVEQPYQQLTLGEPAP